MFLKILFRLEEPIAMKGRMLSELLKDHKANSMVCDNSRGVRVSDQLSKYLHGWSRKQILPSFLGAARRSMHGVLPCRGTALCAHLGREFYAYAKFKGMSASQVYVDIIGVFDAAFHQVRSMTTLLRTCSSCLAFRRTSSGQCWSPSDLKPVCRLAECRCTGNMPSAPQRVSH